MESEDLDDSALDETGDAVESGEPASIPGVCGGVDWIQVDVGRLPRIDQFEQEITPSDSSPTVDQLSDVKTVTYYVLSDDDAGTGYAVDGTESGGLVRRELDRAVALYASDQGGLTESELDEPPIAPEVTALEFAYWDGTEWVEEWDSEEMGALPGAVQITMTLRPMQHGGTALSSWEATAEDAEAEEELDLLVYRLVVHLRAAEASSGGQASEEELSVSTE
jgi:hypothetical protein